jgi:hypothetical protein
VKTSVALLAGLGAGLVAGYLAYPWVHRQPELASLVAGSCKPDAARILASCDLGPEQIDHLAARLAPRVVEQLATSGLSGVTPDPAVAARQRDALEKRKSEQSQAFTRATQLIDQMIANRRITQEGINEANALLVQSGQPDRSHELMARVSAAVTRGELTPVQAGLLPSELAR